MSYETGDCMTGCEAAVGPTGGRDNCHCKMEPEGLRVQTSVVLYLDKYGFPVTKFQGRPILNFFRRLIHARRRVRVPAVVVLPRSKSR